ncbi:hypothetical protein HK098_002065 [Nowakowskiella sp. JEL0407]|nr:hypothetical protein HK098_002065 [Nowakowskiella sp. JEL0407]
MPTPVGLDWRQHFLDNIRKAHVVILLVSKATMQSFGKVDTADTVIFEWDRALELSKSSKYKLLPVLVLEPGESDLEFDVTLSNIPAKDCTRSPSEIWNEIRETARLKVDFTRMQDIKVLDDEITALFAVNQNSPPTMTPTEQTTILKYAIISGAIKNPRNCIGREEIVSNIAKTFADTSRNAAVVIYGGPGMGKTTIASRYAYYLELNGSTPYTHVLWISLFSDSTFEVDIKRTSQLLNFADDDNFDRLKEGVIRWLSQNRSYLVVFDNADSVGIVQKNLGEFVISGHAIITTRNPTIDEFISLGISKDRILRQEITTWSKNITRNYVYSRLTSRIPKTQTEIDSLDKILDFVDGYPLVVEQMCSFLLYASFCGFGEYLGRILAKDNEIWEHTPANEASSFIKTLDATFNATIEFFTKAGDLVPLALLGAIGCVANKDIPIHTYLKDFLVEAGFDANLLNDSIKTLFSISLISIDNENSTISVHLAIQDVIRRRIQRDILVPTSFVDIAESTLKKLIPVVETDIYTQEQLTRGKSILPHVLEHSIVKEDRDYSLGLLCYDSARFAQYISSFNVARTLNHTALDLFTEIYGSREHEMIAHTIYALGMIATEQGDYKTAIKYFSESRETYQLLYRTRHNINVANAIVWLGINADNMGKVEEAIKYYEESLEIYDRVNGSREHSSVADVINNLGVIAYVREDYVNAEKRFLDSRSIFEKVYGNRFHAKVANSINNHVLVLIHQKKYSEAKLESEESLAICEKVYPNKSNTISAHTLGTFGLLAYYMGNIDEGDKYTAQALETFEKLYGTRNHLSIAFSLHEIGVAFKDIGFVERARSCLTESVEISGRLFGSKHPMYIKAVDALEKLKECEEENVSAKVNFVEPTKKKLGFHFSFKKTK